MEAIFLGAAALACPLGMGAMMWFMAKGMKSKDDKPSPVSANALREEHRRLGAEIEQLEGAGRPVSGAQS